MKIITIVGARPQFIKAAAVSRVIASDPDVDEMLVHTGQHYDSNMSDVFFDELGIPAPSHHLAINQGTHGRMTGRMLEAIETIIIGSKPDAVMVYGDTNSTLAGALAASKLHIPVIHVEAGLRSFNRAMPEEINRVLTDHVSALLLCPTRTAVAHLASEGITTNVHHVGDVMFDATLYAHAVGDQRSTILDDLDLRSNRFSLCTLHRAESTDDKAQLTGLLAYLESQLGQQSCILPLHPRTKAALETHGLELPTSIRAIDPVGPLDMAQLLGQCEMVFTDSGGLQKEAYFHRKPCVTLRSETEWVETVEAGWNRLWTSTDWHSPRRDIDDYGTGNAAAAVVAALKNNL